MNLSRRDALRVGAGLGMLTWLDGLPLSGRQESQLIMRAIPSSGERIPVIGLGSARTFNLDPSSPDAAEPLEVVRLFHEQGGAVMDTAPSYGFAEAFVGRAISAVEAPEDLFLATKVNVEGQGRDAAFAQMEESSHALGRSTVDLMQVWNLGDNFRRLSDRNLAAHLDAVREWRAQGRTRYIGITTSFPQQYSMMEEALRREELDFVQVDYSIGDRVPEQRLLDSAADRGVAVLVNQPFSTGGLFSRVAGKDLPGFAEDFDCASWAQFFLKYIVSHPAVTCAIPATSDPEHLVDNMGAAFGRLPDTRTRRRMVEVFESL